MSIIFGISNCDTVKKAIKWLDNQQIPFTFHDFRKEGLDETLIERFLTQATWQELINKRSTTYRNLTPDIKENLIGELALKTVLEQPTLIKRPILLHNEQLHIGFKAAQYQEIFTHE